MTGAERFEGYPQESDPEHPDLGYTISEPLPYYPQERPHWAARVLVMTVMRRYRCRAKWRCSWPATEQGGTCDRHGW